MNNSKANRISSNSMKQVFRRIVPDVPLENREMECGDIGANSIGIPQTMNFEKYFLIDAKAPKCSLCYDAYKILHEKIHYPELVLRALQLMLKASEKTRIANPFGWLWTCLHGNGDGTTPWVQLLTADEESNNSEPFCESVQQRVTRRDVIGPRTKNISLTNERKYYVPGLICTTHRRNIYR